MGTSNDVLTSHMYNILSLLIFVAKFPKSGKYGGKKSGAIGEQAAQKASDNKFPSSFENGTSNSDTPSYQKEASTASGGGSEFLPSRSFASNSCSSFLDTSKNACQNSPSGAESGLLRPEHELAANDSNDEDNSFKLDELLKFQQDTLTGRRSSQTSRFHRNKDSEMSRRHGNEGKRHIRGRVTRVKSLSEKWEEYLMSLPRTFFNSREAFKNNSEAAVPGKPLFSGLHIDEFNNADMQRIFRLCFESKIRLGQPKGTYNQFRSACGQYLRSYISFHPRRAETVCESGELFKAIEDLRLVRAFIGQYQVRASATTVTGKATHLRRLADEAIAYFTEKNRQEQKGKCMSVSSYLRNVAASYKTEARRSYRSRNTVDDRIERGALLVPADFNRCLGVATKALDGIVSYVEQLRIEHEGCMQELHRALSSQKGLLEKWSINLLASLVLGGGGQRPQVYAQLELPSISDLQRFAEDCEGQKKYFALRAGYEKTTRSIDLPKVILPRMLLRFIDCHTMNMRPAIVLQHRNSLSRSTGTQLNEGEFEVHPQALENTLLIHTRNGKPLSSSGVKRSLSRFLGEVDPELSGITPMAIRGSYASMMLQARRKKEIMVDMAEREFLEFLAKQMNTSCEQLATTYASCDVDGFESVANEVMMMLSCQEEDGTTGRLDDGLSDVALDRSAVCNLWG
jgi:hypothetical protein